MSFFSGTFRAGYASGTRGAKDGKPMGLWPQQSERFRAGYTSGYEDVLAGPQQTYSDLVSDLLLAHDVEHEIEEDEQEKDEEA